MKEKQFLCDPLISYERRDKSTNAFAETARPLFRCLITGALIFATLAGCNGDPQDWLNRRTEPGSRGIRNSTEEIASSPTALPSSLCKKNAAGIAASVINDMQKAGWITTDCRDESIEFGREGCKPEMVCTDRVSIALYSNVSNEHKATASRAFRAIQYPKVSYFVRKRFNVYDPNGDMKYVGIISDGEILGRATVSTSPSSFCEFTGAGSAHPQSVCEHRVARYLIQLRSESIDHKELLRILNTISVHLGGQNAA